MTPRRDSAKSVAGNQRLSALDLISVDGPGGGAESIVFRTAMAARAKDFGFTTTVCCLRRTGDAAYDMDRRAKAAGIDYCEVTERSAVSFGTFPLLCQVIRNRHIDAVHAHGYKAVFYAFFLAKTLGVIPVSTSHGWDGHHLRERFVYYPGERRLIRSFPRAIAVSSQIRDTLIRSGCVPERVSVLLNGVDPGRFRRTTTISDRVRASLGIKPGEVLLGAVGRLESPKRFDVLLETAALLLARRRSVRVAIAGDGSLKRSLQKQIHDLGIGPACVLLGQRDDVDELYQSFDVLVQSSDQEGTPTVLLEAMASEVPVVATDAGGTRELIEDGVHGLIVGLRKPSALADAIESTLEDREATARRVAAARRRVETELSFEMRMWRLSHIYQEVTSGKVGCLAG